MSWWRVERTWLVAGVVVLMAGGCAARNVEPPPQTCDDTVRVSGDVPAAMRQSGLVRGVGIGDVWFIDPEIPRWSDRLDRQGDTATAKLPIWVGTSTLPQVTVAGILGTAGDGTAELRPTSEGIPGPVPMGVSIPGPGCWQVTVRGETGSASILVKLATTAASPQAEPG